METIHTGWLVKSPRERPWKLLKPKWRRRYFVLCVSQASTTLPGQCPASLDYYDNEKQSHKRGSIDLNNCDEVLTKLASPQYEHVFSLRTKHKDHYRTYFLAAESENEMNRWIQCLCTVLQLDDAETNSDASLSVANSGSLATVDERYVRVPQMPATPPVPPSSTTGFATSPVLTPDEFDASSTLTEEDKGEAYILLDQCYSGSATSSNTQRPNLHGADGSLPQISTSQPLHMNQNPVKADNSRMDHKRTDYCNISVDGDDNNISKRQRAFSHPNTANTGASGKIYDFPSGVVRCGNQKSQVAGPTNRAFQSIKSHCIGADKKMEINSAKISLPAQVQSNATVRLVSSSQSPILLSDKDYDFPSYINLNSMNSSSSSSHDASIHRYMNAASMPVSSQSPCSSPKIVASANGSHLALAHSALNSPTLKKGDERVAGGTAHLAPTDGAPTSTHVTEMEPPVMSGRTQSFKRTIVHAEVPLPIKKCSQNEDTSSSDDDASDDDSEDKMEELPPVPLPPKKRSLDAVVQPLQRKDAVQYLDLNLDELGKGERSPAVSRSAHHLASSETNYNEIDWIKTKALLETKKDLESERHNSEKSSD